jgi:Arc/MetJ family transcription regulator
MFMTRITVDIDEHAFDLAQTELGTKGKSATVNAALREIGRRHLLAGFDVTRDVDGTSQEVQANRYGCFPQSEIIAGHLSSS